MKENIQQQIRTQAKSPFKGKNIKQNTNVGNITNTSMYMSQNYQQQSTNPYSLKCQKHTEQYIYKICINQSCEYKDNIFCCECVYDNQQHFCNHKSSIISYNDFIEQCKTLSFKFKDELGKDLNQKQLTSLLLDLDNQSQKYKTHIKREEEKIDADFNQIIDQFVTDINDIKNKIKFQLNQSLNHFLEVSHSLQQKAKEANKTKITNHNYKNDFDELLQNILQVNQKPYNLKKLMINIFPFINKSEQCQKTVHNQILQQQNNFMNQTKESDEQQIYFKSPTNKVQNYDAISQVSAITQLTNFTMNKQYIQMMEPLMNTYQEFKDLIDNKPFYRNKGAANTVYKNTFTETRKLYYSLIETLNDFVMFPENRKISLQCGTTNAHNNIINNSIINQHNLSIINQSQSNQIVAISLMNSPSQQNKNCSPEKRQFNYSSQKQQLFSENFNKSTMKLQSSQHLADQMEIYSQERNENIILKSDEQFPEKLDHIKQIESNHKAGILCLKMIDNDTFLSGSRDKTLKIWNCSQNNKFEIIKSIQFKSDISCIECLYRVDGSKYILCGLYKQFAVLDSNFEIFKIIDVEADDQVNQILGLKDGETVVYTSHDPRITCINIFQDEIRPKKYFDHRDLIYVLDQFSCKNFFASAGRDKTIKIWKLIFYKDYKNNCLEQVQLDLNIKDAHKADVTALKSSKNNPDILISGCSNGEIKIWEITNGSVIKTFKNFFGWVYKLIIIEKENKVINDKKLLKESMKIEKDNFHLALLKKNSSSKKIIKKKNSRFNNQSVNFSESKFLQKNYNEVIQNIGFLSASIDGSLQIWDAGQANPVFTAQSKNDHDCYPFGGFEYFKQQGLEHYSILMSGNNKDKCINLWGLK